MKKSSFDHDDASEYVLESSAGRNIRGNVS